LDVAILPIARCRSVKQDAARGVWRATTPPPYAPFDDVAISPLGLALLDELNRRGYSLDNASTDEVFDAVATELMARVDGMQPPGVLR
jgi:hypothetical protein